MKHLRRAPLRPASVVLPPPRSPPPPIICCTFLLSSRHIASFLSMFKLVVIGLIIVGKDPFALFGMPAPGIWEWGQGNKASLAHAAPGILVCMDVHM